MRQSTSVVLFFLLAVFGYLEGYPQSEYQQLLPNYEIEPASFVRAPKGNMDSMKFGGLFKKSINAYRSPDLFSKFDRFNRKIRTLNGLVLGGGFKRSPVRNFLENDGVYGIPDKQQQQQQREAAFPIRGVEDEKLQQAPDFYRAPTAYVKSIDETF